MAGSGRRNADGLLAAALAVGKTIAEAAAEASVGERTAYRRMQEPAFRAQVSRLRGGMQERAVGLLAEASAEAATTLSELVSGARSESIRLGAARAILELGVRLREMNELDERVSMLEVDAERRERDEESQGSRSADRGAWGGRTWRPGRGRAR